jgi:hypothetical protein
MSLIQSQTVSTVIRVIVVLPSVNSKSLIVPGALALIDVLMVWIV